MKLSDVKKGKHEPGDCGNPSDQLPQWMDMDRFQRGQNLFKKHISMMILALHCSLTTGFAIINLLIPLVFTEQSNTAVKAMKRYIATGYHLLTWHLENVWEAPDGRGYKSIMTVRNMHNTVAKAMNDKLKDKVYISQYDMGLVQAGFFGGFIMHHKKFGISCTRQELEDYIFFWRGIGYLLGIDDKYNVCSSGYDDAYNICKEIEEDILIPGLKNKPKDFDMMADAYINGTNMSLGFPVYSTKSVEAFVASTSENTNYDPPKLGFVDTLRFFYLKFLLFMVKWCPGFENFLNHGAMKASKDMFKKHLNIVL